MAQHKKTRKFGGQTYRLHRKVKTKSEANRLKARYKDEGYKVRIIKKDYGYCIYKRRV